VKGAQGKIKGSGVTPRLKPCLHIDFHAPKAERLGGMGFTQLRVKYKIFVVSPCF